MPIEAMTRYYIYCDTQDCDSVFGESDRYPASSFGSIGQAVRYLTENSYYGDEDERWFLDDNTQRIMCISCRRQPHVFVADIEYGDFGDSCVRCGIDKEDHIDAGT